MTLLEIPELSATLCHMGPHLLCQSGEVQGSGLGSDCAFGSLSSPAHSRGLLLAGSWLSKRRRKASH